jgi:phage shock protein PspC (stress-responsive transcriptional regulator)
MWSKQFWRDAAERAVKTAAQTLLGVIAGLQVTTGMDWQTVLVSAGIATGLSVLTSLLSSLSGTSASASAVE